MRRSKLHRMKLRAAAVALEGVDAGMLQTHVAVEKVDIFLADEAKSSRTHRVRFLLGRVSFEHSALGSRRNASNELLSDLERSPFHDLTETL